jgi:hypothetical protein
VCPFKSKGTPVVQEHLKITITNHHRLELDRRGDLHQVVL